MCIRDRQYRLVALSMIDLPEGNKRFDFSVALDQYQGDWKFGLTAEQLEPYLRTVDQKRLCLRKVIAYFGEQTLQYATLATSPGDPFYEPVKLPPKENNIVGTGGGANQPESGGNLTPPKQPVEGMVAGNEPRSGATDPPKVETNETVGNTPYPLVHTPPKTRRFNTDAPSSSGDGNEIPVGVADFDGDGVDELLVRAYGKDESYWYIRIPNQTSPIWTTAGAYNGAIALADFDGDGKDDLLYSVTASHRDRLRIKNHTSIPDFEEINDIPFLDQQVAGVGDVNGDGRADIVFRENVARQQVIFHAWISKQGTGSNGQAVNTFDKSNKAWTYTVDIGAGEDFEIIDVVDMDSDKRADLVLKKTKGSDHSCAVVRSESNGFEVVTGDVFSSTNSPAKFKRVSTKLGNPIAIGDVTGDGNPDLVVSFVKGEKREWQVYVSKKELVTKFGETPRRRFQLDSRFTASAPTTNSGIVGLADLNRDDIKDLVFAYPDSERLVYEGRISTINGFGFARKTSMYLGRKDVWAAKPRPSIRKLVVGETMQAKFDGFSRPAGQYANLGDMNGDGYVDLQLNYQVDNLTQKSNRYVTHISTDYEFYPNFSDRRLAVFVGGLNDKHKDFGPFFSVNNNVLNYHRYFFADHNRLAQSNGLEKSGVMDWDLPMIGLETPFFEWTEAGAIHTRIREFAARYPNAPVCIIGHSLGGDASWQAVQLSEDRQYVDLMVTLDSVSQETVRNVKEGLKVIKGFLQTIGILDRDDGGRSKPIGLEKWINVYALNTDESNVVAALGGSWDSEENADINYASGATHAEVQRMFEFGDFGKKLPRATVRNGQSVRLMKKTSPFLVTVETLLGDQTPSYDLLTTLRRDNGNGVAVNLSGENIDWSTYTFAKPGLWELFGWDQLKPGFAAELHGHHFFYQPTPGSEGKPVSWWDYFAGNYASLQRSIGFANFNRSDFKLTLSDDNSRPAAEERLLNEGNDLVEYQQFEGGIYTADMGSPKYRLLKKTFPIDFGSHDRKRHPVKTYNVDGRVACYRVEANYWPTVRKRGSFILQTWKTTNSNEEGSNVKWTKQDRSVSVQVVTEGQNDQGIWSNFVGRKQGTYKGKVTVYYTVPIDETNQNTTPVAVEQDQTPGFVLVDDDRHITEVDDIISGSDLPNEFPQQFQPVAQPEDEQPVEFANAQDFNAGYVPDEIIFQQYELNGPTAQYRVAIGIRGEEALSSYLQAEQLESRFPDYISTTPDGRNVVFSVVSRTRNPNKTVTLMLDEKQLQFLGPSLDTTEGKVMVRTAASYLVDGAPKLVLTLGETERNDRAMLINVGEGQLPKGFGNDFYPIQATRLSDDSYTVLAKRSTSGDRKRSEVEPTDLALENSNQAEQFIQQFAGKNYRVISLNAWSSSPGNANFGVVMASAENQDDWKAELSVMPNRLDGHLKEHSRGEMVVRNITLYRENDQYKYAVLWSPENDQRFSSKNVGGR